MSDISFHVPVNFEDELDRYYSRNGKHILNFRSTALLNSGVIERVASFIVEGIPYTALSSTNVQEPVKVTNNLVMASSLVDHEGNLKDHPWLPEGYQAIYSDLLIKNENKLFTQRAFQETVHETRRSGLFGKKTVSWTKEAYKITERANKVVVTAVNAIYVDVGSSGNVVGVSPLLQELMIRWEKRYKKVPTQKDFFGTDRIKGIPVTVTPYGSDGVSVTTDEWRSVQVYLDTRTSTYSGSPTKLILMGDDSRLEDPVIGLRYRFDELSFALKTENYLLPPNPEQEPEEDEAVTTNGSDFRVARKTSSGPLSGSAPPGSIVKAVFYPQASLTEEGDLKTSGSAITSFKEVPMTGSTSWVIDYPPGYIAENAELIEVTYTNPNLGSTNIKVENKADPYKISDKDIMTVNGVPVFRVGGYARDYGRDYAMGAATNLIQNSYQYKFSKGAISISHTFVRSEPVVALLSGVYFGRALIQRRTGFFGSYRRRTDLSPLYKTFLSFPGSVVEETGVELFYASEVFDKDTGSTTTLNPFARPLVVTSAGPEKRTPQQMGYNISWSSDPTIKQRIRAKLKWTKNFEPQRMTYNISWQRGVEPVNRSVFYKVSWLNDRPKVVRDYYNIWWLNTLPQDRVVKQFYKISWDKSPIVYRKDSYILSWESEKIRTRRDLYNISWLVSLIDRVVLKPYYVRLWENDKFIDCVSFEVYGDFDYLEQYISANKYFVYFSNPTKFETVRFDYNMMPYHDIFLTELQEPKLGNREEVPERFIKLGNYTIKGIDINSSLSLDIFAGNKQMNEWRSYWVPDNLDAYRDSFITLKDGKSQALALEYKFRDDHHVDIVELELTILDQKECCFTKTSVGSSCSPY